MNVINLKTLSLSALMTSTMITGAFSMKIDQDSQIKNVSNARSIFEQKPVSVNIEKKILNIGKTNGQSVKGSAALYDKAGSPVKQTKEIKTTNYRKHIDKAAENSGCNLLPTRAKVLSEVEAESQILQATIADLKTSIPLQQELYHLQKLANII